MRRVNLFRRFSTFCSMVLLLAIFILPRYAIAVTDVYMTTGNYTWTAPVGVTSVTVEAWGGGGAGGGARGRRASGGGAAGGQYAEGVISVTPGNGYVIVIGSGGAGSTRNGQTGGDSTFNTTSIVAKGGAGGGEARRNDSNGSGGIGTASGGVGDIVYAGGNGAGGSSRNYGGAGGGGAGSSGAGGSATSTTAGSGTLIGGGSGGARQTGNNSAGRAGNVAGGGGGGGHAISNTDQRGGNGAAGQMHITYVLAPSVSSITLASVNPTTANTLVSWTVDFSNSVSGVDVTDFVLVEAGGVTGSNITSVSGSGMTWTVTANSGTADTGTLGLNLVDDDSIINAGGIPLGDVGVGNGNYVGPVYALTSPAAVLSKVASTSAAAIGDVITFTISASNSYSDPLSNVVVTDLLPVGMTYVSHSVTLGNLTVTGQTLTWTLATLAAGSSENLTLAVSLTQQGIIINEVNSPGSTTASATVLVLGSAVTHFKMDEPVGTWSGTSGEVVDSGGTSLHGRWNSTSGLAAPIDPSPSISSQHSTVVGNFCNAATFDGNSVVEVADSPSFDYTTELSATVWIYPTSYPSSGLYSILSNDVNYEFHLNSSGQLFWWWQASTLASAATIPLNQWTHVAITFDSSSGVRRQRIYVNGVPDANTNNWQGTLATNDCRVHIGGDVNTGDCSVIPSRNFHGMIDEVKLYGFEMTQAQVQADMTMGRLCSGTFDHIRIEHDGVASICAPETVTIKACMDSDCNALYPGNVTVNLLPFGWVGGGTFTFSGGISSRQLSIGTPGDVTLGTASISPTPADSSRCFNGATETCTLNFATASCAFDAVESTGAPQSPIYTKLSGVPFNIDVLALLDATTINTAYTGTVTIDLVDATGSACPIGAGLNASTNISFALPDVGRKTVSFNYPGAARNVRVRVVVGASAPACSSDNFVIRPRSLSISSTDANNTALTGLPVVVAGDSFSLSATAVTGYDGTPLINTALISGTPIAGSLTGSFLAASAASGVASSSNFIYSEVGHFGLSQYAVYDDVFTQVDAVKNECTSNFSNILSGGMYGCSFGSLSVPITIGTSGFGRFVPARFNITGNTPILANACGSSFTYLGQPFGYLVDPELTLTALNRSGAVTLNYGGSYWRMNSNLNNHSYINNVATTAAVLSISTFGSVSWSETGDSDGDGIVHISGEELTYSKPISPEAPFVTDADLVFAINDLTDSDGVCYDPESDSICNTYTISSLSGGAQRYGRIQLQNAYGPETLPLTIPVLTEYFDGTNFVLNSLDSCTPYDTTHLAFNNYQGNLASGETTASGSGTLLSGIGNSLSLSAPGVGNDGSVDLTLDLSQATGSNMEWLQPGGNNPTAKATFGIFRGNQRLIYMRESVW